MQTAWHGDAKLKKSFVDRLEAHRKADELRQGSAKNCNIGCLFDYYDHAKGAEELGIPEVLLRLADTIFEGLSVKEANDFAIEWPRAIKPGADLSKVRWQFCAFIMRENIERVLLLKIDDKLKEQVVAAIRDVLALHEDSAKTGRSAAESAAWSAARSAAESAAESAWSAWSAAESAARSAAWSAARSAESAAWSAESAESAAWSAAWSAESAESAESAARSAAYKRYAKEFVRLLKEDGKP